MPSDTAASQNSGTSLQPATRTSIIHWLALVLLMIAAAAVRLHYLAYKPFWFDETFSVEIARIDWKSFLHLLWWREANMSLYYLLLRIWLLFGTSGFFIRSLSVVFAVATLPTLYWLARSLYGRKVALIAAALFALNDFDIRYSQEARSYALFLLLATLSSGFLIRFLREPKGRYRTSYVVFSIVSVYAHFYALLLLIAHWIVLRYVSVPDNDVSRERVWADLKRAWITIAIAVAPLIIFVAKTGAGPIRWIQRPGLFDILNFWLYFSGGVPVLTAAACLIALYPVYQRLWKRNHDFLNWRVQFLAVWLLFPILLTLALSMLKPVFYPRYMIFCLPPLLILAAVGLASLGQKWLQAAAVCVILLLSARMIPFVYTHDFEDERDGAGQATNFILDHAQSGDGIIFHIPQIRVPYQFFASLRAGHAVGSDGFGPSILYPRHGDRLQYLDFKSKLSPDYLHSAVAGHPRVWVVLMYNGPKLPDPTAVLLKDDLPSTYPKVERWSFPKVEVLLYSTP